MLRSLPGAKCSWEKAVYFLWGGGLPALKVFTESSSGTGIARQMSIYLKGLAAVGPGGR